MVKFLNEFFASFEWDQIFKKLLEIDVNFNLWVFIFYQNSEANISLFIPNKMANPDFAPDTGHEIDSLVNREESWTRMDKLLLVFGVVVNLGDGVEIYLPGLSN